MTDRRILARIASDYDRLADRYEDSWQSEKLSQRIRNKIVLSNLERFLPGEPSRILDAGGGTGFYSLPLAAEGHDVTILDVSKGMLGEARRKAIGASVSGRMPRVILGGMERLPFPDGRFDLVLCHLALVYLEDPERGLQEFSRVIRKGGMISLLEPNRNHFVLKRALRGEIPWALDALRQDPLYVQPTSGLPEIRPIDLNHLLVWCQELGLSVAAQIPVRVVSDHLGREVVQKREKEIIHLEMELSKNPSLCSISAHIHLILKR